MVNFIAMIAVGVFVVVAGISWLGSGFGWEAEPTPEENAARVFPHLFDDWVPMGHRVVLVHGAVPPTFTGASTRWFQVSVPREDMPAIERDLGRKLRSVSAMPRMDSNAPSWWHPETLADGMIYSTDYKRTGKFFVTSCSTGMIYYYFQGH